MAMCALNEVKGMGLIMIARITNFVSMEKQSIAWLLNLNHLIFYNFVNMESHTIDWDKRIPKIRHEWREFNIDIYNKLLEQFYLLLEKYPDSLKDEVIIEKYQELKKYAKKHKTDINNLYSYYNKIELDALRDNIYGIRIIPVDDYYNDRYITITNYNTTESGMLLKTNELKLNLDKDGISFISMTEVNPVCTQIFDGEYEKKFVKHL